MSELERIAYQALTGDMEAPSASHMASTFRSAAKIRNLAPFHIVQLTFSQPMAVLAYWETQNLWQGFSMSMFTNEDYEEEQGFYAGRSDLFHLDSVDFEHEVLEIEEKAQELSFRMFSSNVNAAQAVSVSTMTRTCRGWFTGSIVDICRFARTVRRRTEVDHHPHTRDLAETMMAELMANHRLALDALIEGEAV